MRFSWLRNIFYINFCKVFMKTSFKTFVFFVASNNGMFCNLFLKKMNLFIIIDRQFWITKHPCQIIEHLSWIILVFCLPGKPRIMILNDLQMLHVLIIKTKWESLHWCVFSKILKRYHIIFQKDLLKILEVMYVIWQLIIRSIKSLLDFIIIHTVCLIIFLKIRLFSFYEIGGIVQHIIRLE